LTPKGPSLVLRTGTKNLKAGEDESVRRFTKGKEKNEDPNPRDGTR
jgi:hypothetical protein